MHPRTSAELQSELLRQIKFLRRSCKIYDEGEYDEAARIAVSISVIVSDDGQRSILSQLNKKPSFVSYAYPNNPNNLVPEHPLVMMRLGSQASRYEPVLDDGPPFARHTTKFGLWWDKEAVFSTHKGNALTRRQLVSVVRSQDGGAHFGEIKNSTYFQFSREPLWFVSNGVDADKPLEPWPHLPTVRQIAFELETSLVQAGMIPAP